MPPTSRRRNSTGGRSPNSPASRRSTPSPPENRLVVEEEIATTPTRSNTDDSDNSLLATAASESPQEEPAELPARGSGAPFVWIQEEDMMMNALLASPRGEGPRGGRGDAETTAAWQEERERRQRTVRVLLMFLLLLLLMDNDEQQAHSQRLRQKHHSGLRGGSSSSKSGPSSSSLQQQFLSKDVFTSRQEQDARLKQWSRQQPRYQTLQQLNTEQQQQGIDDSTTTAATASNIILHYPWNSTGFYRGDWTRSDSSSSSGASKEGRWNSPSLEAASKGEAKTVSAVELEAMLTQQQRTGSIGVGLLPPGLHLEMRNDHNLTATGFDQQQVDTRGKVYPAPVVTTSTTSKASAASSTKHWWESTTDTANSIEEAGANNIEEAPKVTLTRDQGRLALQLYSRTIPAMSELSLVEGFVKLYDSGGSSANSKNPNSYASATSASTRRDMLFRVRGVLIHSVGQLSLVSSAGGTTRSALVMMTSTSVSASEQALQDDVMEVMDGDDGANEQVDVGYRRRRLEESLSSVNLADHVDLIRDDTLALYNEEEYGMMNQEPDSDHQNWTLMLSHSSSSLVNESDGLADVHESAEEDLFQLYRDSVAVQQDESFANPAQRASHGAREEFVGGTKVADDSPTHIERKTQEVWETVSPMKTHRGAQGGSGSLSPNAFMKSEAFPSSVMDTDQKKALSLFSDHEHEQVHVSSQMDITKLSSPTASASNDPAAKLPPWSDVIIPFPYVLDDADETIRKTKTSASRRMPPREQLLEANAAACEFEINLNVGEVEWTAQALQALLTRRKEVVQKLNPYRSQSEKEQEEKREAATALHPHPAVRASVQRRGGKKGPVEQQALVMNMVGTLHSPNCGFSATVNATALRTDWDATTSKAINYSFYMMLVCLTQIMILLRQLLHSQAQSAATRVSLLCIGWQTVIDALICLAHIYLSLAIQPLFTAFASVAFFKLLIFCVIEMKYMAIIIQARNSSNNNAGQTADELRRQVALLHIRFYLALFAAFLLLFYFGDKYRVLYVLALYSFWMPQIVNNIITEAKTPLHQYYIYGMSLTRLVAPLYLFAMKKNFLKEVYPDSPTDPFLCGLLAAWIFIQASVLIAQGKYGARFMIPARFLPPKFDYSRPLPPSMLPPGMEQDAPVQEIMTMDDDDDVRKPSAKERKRLLSSRDSSPAPSRGRHTTAVTTRNRLKGKSSRNRRGGGNRADKMSVMTTETVDRPTSNSKPTIASIPTEAPCLECSICYENIDIRHRNGYMLAPCDHLFHRDCLVQWMDVKMECPICRTELPAL